jgi:hypothetical protein
VALAAPAHASRFFVSEVDVERAKIEVARKKPEIDPAGLRFERIRQGECVQILHIGPYATEDASIEKMFDFMKAQGLEVAGPHHEVYLSDPNRSKPENIKTILRQPVRNAPVESESRRG